MGLSGVEIAGVAKDSAFHGILGALGAECHTSSVLHIDTIEDDVCFNVVPFHSMNGAHVVRTLAFCSFRWFHIIAQLSTCSRLRAEKERPIERPMLCH